MSGFVSAVEAGSGAARPRYRWWHAGLFWLVVNAPGWVFAWREALFPGFRVPALRPPGAAFPVIWFVITVAALGAGLRTLNRRGMPRRALHLRLQAAFWLAYLVFPAFFFGLSSVVAGFVLTFGIFVVAAAEVLLLWRDDRTAALLLVPLLLWTGFAGLYVAPMQVLLNPDPLLGTRPLLG
jgi:translocator protein